LKSIDDLRTRTVSCSLSQVRATQVQYKYGLGRATPATNTNTNRKPRPSCLSFNFAAPPAPVLMHASPAPQSTSAFGTEHPKNPGRRKTPFERRLTLKMTVSASHAYASRQSPPWVAVARRPRKTSLAAETWIYESRGCSSSRCVLRDRSSQRGCCARLAASTYYRWSLHANCYRWDCNFLLTMNGPVSTISTISVSPRYWSIGSFWCAMIKLDLWVQTVHGYARAEPLRARLRGECGNHCSMLR